MIHIIFHLYALYIEALLIKSKNYVFQNFSSQVLLHIQRLHSSSSFHIFQRNSGPYPPPEAKLLQMTSLSLSSLIWRRQQHQHHCHVHIV